MTKSQRTGSIRYEYIVYVHLLGTYRVSEILLTKDDFADKISHGNQVKWIPVENMDTDIIDTIREADDTHNVFQRKAKNRICGLFDTEPVDWKYARIRIDNNAGKKQNVAIAKMPRSPIVPVIFDIND